MTAGDAAGWDDFFVGHLIPSVLALVLDAWDRIEKPAEDEREDTTSLRLYAAMIRGKDRQRHFFLIRLHHEILAMEPPGEMRQSSIRPADAHAKETHHQRHDDAALFRLHHLFVAGLQRCIPIVT